jgi:hypothetical protein
MMFTLIGRLLILSLVLLLSACLDEQDRSELYVDADGDGFGSTQTLTETQDVLLAYVNNRDDCNDNNASINPLSIEIYDQLDNNCNGQVDEGTKIDTFFIDRDGDGFGDPETSVTVIDIPQGYVRNNNDCDDSNPDINPNREEIFDELDNNCDKRIDEGFIIQSYYRDRDDDGFGNKSSVVMTLLPPEGYVSDNRDCDDNNATINPDQEEILDGLDNNCDGQIDEGIPLTTFYLDSDMDNYGDISKPREAAAKPEGFVQDNTDCDDGNAQINPLQAEIYDSIDNNCNGLIDEGFNPTSWYRDNDNDDYGDKNQSVVDVNAPAGYVSNSGDCNDNDAAINPGQQEIFDQLDNDCDGEIDEGINLTVFYQDKDKDNYGNFNITKEARTKPVGYVNNSSDCNDNDAAINPGQEEILDQLDNDCDGEIDEGVALTVFYQDKDKDRYGNFNKTRESIKKPRGYVEDNTDCNDRDKNINPSKPELYDSIDNNCNGLIDEGFKPSNWYRDDDGDSYGDPERSIVNIKPPRDYVDDNTDCDDKNKSINPAAKEIFDGIDNNCNAIIDEGFNPVSWYRDADKDRYGDQDVSVIDIRAPRGYVADNTDCDDSNRAINPQQVEVYDGIDNNCDGAIDENP